VIFSKSLLGNLHQAKGEHHSIKILVSSLEKVRSLISNIHCAGFETADHTAATADHTEWGEVVT